MIRPFLQWPDKRLRTPCAPVETVDDAVRATWEDMLDSMYAMPGVGLAACQIGVMLRLAVVDCSEARTSPIRMANPVVLHASVKPRSHVEASPNLPGIHAEVERPRAVTVGYMDETGAQVERDFVHLEATSVQHQIDHLDGLVYLDRLKPARRQMLLSKYMKARARAGRR
ncbi:peptide deformylase [Paroceanicella profunda]|uniref:Peptide deformylase-like n=1 Tax=Paroceanicella profunda TaxID=2579971 RepID=A0A5B8FUX2_9RHOB|nr:peptide deformylase [Paroceanicella profunda]QDL92165.1 peptide deformylase [Paroceanicella profunda]